MLKQSTLKDNEDENKNDEKVVIDASHFYFQSFPIFDEFVLFKIEPCPDVENQDDDDNVLSTSQAMIEKEDSENPQ